MSFETLDVGCGATPRGDVNVDRFWDLKQCATTWRAKDTPNFVKSDAQFLPFREKAFKKLYAVGVLEHLINPLEALKEWRRVARSVEIRVPSAFSLDGTETHLFTWNERTLRALLLRVFPYVRVWHTRARVRVFGRVSKYFPLLNLLIRRFPSELEAIAWD